MQLVINSPGTFITQKDECFRLKQKERVFDISPLKVESINKHLDIGDRMSSVLVWIL
jgi:hypothetical protein